MAPKKWFLFPTGLRVRMPVSRFSDIICSGQIWPKSGLSVNKGAETGAGLIDADYEGELKIKLYNFSETTFVVEPYTRIAQITFVPVINLNMYTLVIERGEGGFGSTGLS